MKAGKPKRGRARRRWRRYYLRKLPRRKTLQGTWAHRILGNRLFDQGLWTFTRESTARGLAVGMFMGLMPFIGLQIALALIACFLLRVNLIAAVTATFVCNPLTAVGIIWLQLLIGRWLLNPGVIDPAGDPAGAVNFLLVNGKALMAGSLITAIPSALLTYLLARLFWRALTRGTIEP